MRVKDSTHYFMTEMTQEEFEERTKGWKKVTQYKFNTIKSSLSSEAERRTVNAMAKGSNPLESDI